MIERAQGIGEAGRPLVTRRWPFLLAPAIATSVAAPWARLPFVLHLRGAEAWFAIGALPLVLGLLAAPGYVAALGLDPRRLRTRAIRRLWIRTSLALGLASASAGVCGALWLLLVLRWRAVVTPFWTIEIARGPLVVLACAALATSVCCVVLWRRLERAR